MKAILIAMLGFILAMLGFILATGGLSNGANLQASGKMLAKDVDVHQSIKGDADVKSKIKTQSSRTTYVEGDAFVSVPKELTNIVDTFDSEEPESEIDVLLLSDRKGNRIAAYEYRRLSIKRNHLPEGMIAFTINGMYTIYAGDCDYTLIGVTN